MHLAAALQFRVVAITGPTDAVRTGPYGHVCIVLRSAESVTTVPGDPRRTPYCWRSGMTPVVTAAETLLSGALKGQSRGMPEGIP